MPGPGLRTGLGHIVVAACLWGSFGLFVRAFQEHGLDPATMTFWRAAMGTVITLAFLLATGRIGLLRVSGATLWRLVLYGLISTVLFPFAYFFAISSLPIAVAGILLYTSPVYVVLLAVPLFGELLTWRKLGAVALALGGAALVAGLWSALGGAGPELGGLGAGPDAAGVGGAGPGFSWLGLGAGLLAGLSYAVLSVGGKLMGRAAPPDTVMFYAYLTGTVVLGLIVPTAWQAAPSYPLPLWTGLALMGIGPTFLAYRLFLRGMERLEASVAGIVATIEPVVAAVLGWVVLQETLGPQQIIGGLLVLGAVVLLQVPARRRDTTRPARRTKSAGIGS